MIVTAGPYFNQDEAGIMSEQLLKTPLHDVHLAAGARMGPFGGWDMPIQYAGILHEHHHTRTHASIFDTCHMGEFDLQGPTAQADLENLLTMNVATIREGQCRYGFMLNDEGGVIDDLTCYRRSADHFFLVVNAGTRGGDAAWIQAHLSPDTQFRDLSPHRTKIDVQGPEAREAVEATFGPLPDLGYFRFVDIELGGIPMTLSRTGYTGEWGYEFYFDADPAIQVWNLLVDGGLIQPAGLGARDTLRLEMGYSLYGSELNAQLTPAAATGGGFIHMKKDFIGKAAVAQELEHPTRRLAGLLLDSKRAARAHDLVVMNGKTVGEVTSGSVAPSLDRAVALAYVDADLAALDTELAISVRGKELKAVVTPLPFYENGTARKKTHG
ncbi:MAG: aminomethyltransferase [Kiritimatiellia bacterium]|jgi:aminomethyltransferase